MVYRAGCDFGRAFFFFFFSFSFSDSVSEPIHWICVDLIDISVFSHKYGSTYLIFIIFLPSVIVSEHAIIFLPSIIVSERALFSE